MDNVNAQAVNMHDKREEMALRNCVAERNKKTALPAVAIPAIAGYVLHAKGFIRTPRSMTIGSLALGGFFINAIYNTEKCIKKVREQFPQGTLASKSLPHGQHQWMDSSGDQSQRGQQQPDQAALKDPSIQTNVDHFDGFADSANNPQVLGLDSSNMKTVDDDHVLSGSSRSAAPGQQPPERVTQSYDELRATNRAQQQQQGPSRQAARPGDTSSRDGLLGSAPASQPQASRPKAPQHYDPPQRQAPIRRNKYGDVIEESE